MLIIKEQTGAVVILSDRETLRLIAVLRIVRFDRRVLEIWADGQLQFFYPGRLAPLSGRPEVKVQYIAYRGEYVYQLGIEAPLSIYIDREQIYWRRVEERCAALREAAAKGAPDRPRV